VEVVRPAVPAEVEQIEQRGQSQQAEQRRTCPAGIGVRAPPKPPEPATKRYALGIRVSPVTVPGGDRAQLAISFDEDEDEDEMVPVSGRSAVPGAEGLSDTLAEPNPQVRNMPTLTTVAIRLAPTRTAISATRPGWAETACKPKSAPEVSTSPV